MDSRPVKTRNARITRRRFVAGTAGGALAFKARRAVAKAPDTPKTVFVVPNFHPASCGWLANFSKERVYCANSYLDHLGRVRDDPDYAFVLSEVNNIIAIMNFQPGRVEELRLRIREGRVELVNGFFLESTINLSGGEALVRLGREGLRWQQQVFGVRPRFAWTIDVCGTHDQMAQITKGLGLEAMVYTRKNPTGKTIHWAESPDGSRSLALSPGHYSELDPVFATREALSAAQLEQLKGYFEQKSAITPEGAAVLVLAGHGDYSLAPLRKEYPGEFLRQWKEAGNQTEIRFAVLSQYLDSVLPGIRSGRINLPVMKGGTAYDFNSFWIECPRVKGWFRRCEHGLEAAEALATIASLRSGFEYPVRDLYHAWLMMCLNMDRNTLWGAAGGMVFESEKSWDVRDRFQLVESIAAKTQNAALSALLSPGKSAGLFNPLNWRRNDPVILTTPLPEAFEGVPCQVLPDGRMLAQTPLPSMGTIGLKAAATAPTPSRAAALAEEIETTHYRVKIDPKTGALTSLKTAPSWREVLGGPANVIIAERQKKPRGDPGDQMASRPDRVRLFSSGDSPQRIKTATGPLATIVETEGAFGENGRCIRRMLFYGDHPRIDFEIDLEDVNEPAVVFAEFPLAEDISEVRRGIPYGFSHGAWATPNPDLHGWTRGIVPAVRWSHYSLAGGGGVALFDRGLTGRELNERTPILYLLNAIDKYYGYPNTWLSGKGKHQLNYAMVAHEVDWRGARIPRMAWEYNGPPVIRTGCGQKSAESFLRTSDNLIVEALRRDGSDIELRFVESLGYAGTAEVTLDLPHKEAFLTDLTGGNPSPLKGGPAYRFPIRAQEIVTLRFRAGSSLMIPAPLESWDVLVPGGKRQDLEAYSDQKGHPPRGN